MELLSILSGILLFIITGAIAWIACHITNSEKHPCKKDVVYKDVCEVKSKNLEDCLENEVRESKERYAELKEDMRLGFDEIKQLIKNHKN